MSRVIVAIFCLSSVVSADEILLPVPGDYGVGDIRTEDSKFTGTTVSVADVPLEVVDGPEVLASGKGMVASLESGEPASFLLVITVVADEWVNMKSVFSDTEVYALIDGERDSLPFDLETDVKRGFIVEQYLIHLPVAVYAKHARASLIEIKVGRSEFEIDEYGMAAIKALGGTFQRGTFGENTYKDDPSSVEWELNARKKIDITSLSDDQVRDSIRVALMNNAENVEQEKAEKLAEFDTLISETENKEIRAKNVGELRRKKAEQRRQVIDLKKKRVDFEQNFVPTKLPDFSSFHVGQSGHIHYKTLKTDLDVILKGADSENLRALWVIIDDDNPGLVVEANHDKRIQSSPAIVIGFVERFKKKIPILKLLDEDDIREISEANLSQ